MKYCFASLKKLGFSLILLSSACIYGESFRVAKLNKVQIPQDYTPQTVKAGIYDGVSITLPEDQTFITGIELNIKVPEIVATWRDTIAYNFYENVTPFPSPDNIDYNGKKLPVNTIPGKLNYTIYVPLNSKFALKENPYSKILDVSPELFKNTVFFRFFLAMKGAPEALEHAIFNITVKPVLSDEGKFSLSIKQPEGKAEPYAVYIDDCLTDSASDVVLSTGEHHLSVTSDSFRNEVRTFIIQQAKTTALEIEMRGIEPLIKIIAPENANIQFDGNSITDTKNIFSTTPGDHVIKFTIGDYEVIKTINAVNGRSYTVSLDIDASVSEDE